MHTKTPGTIMQYAGEPLDGLVVRAASQAINDGHFVRIRLRQILKSGADLRVTPDNELEVHAKPGLTDADQVAEHDRLRIVDVLYLSRRLQRDIKLYCSEHPEMYVVVRVSSSEAQVAKEYASTLRSCDIVD